MSLLTKATAKVLLFFDMTKLFRIFFEKKYKNLIKFVYMKKKLYPCALNYVD